MRRSDRLRGPATTMLCLLMATSTLQAAPETTPETNEAQAAETSPTEGPGQAEVEPSPSTARPLDPKPVVTYPNQGAAATEFVSGALLGAVGELAGAAVGKSADSELDLVLPPIMGALFGGIMCGSGIIMGGEFSDNPGSAGAALATSLVGSLGGTLLSLKMTSNQDHGMVAYFLSPIFAAALGTLFYEAVPPTLSSSRTPEQHASKPTGLRAQLLPGVWNGRPGLLLIGSF